MSSGRVAGKVALVTGAGSGIGRAVAVRLAEEGAQVVVTSKTPEHVDETLRDVERGGGSAIGLPLDITDRGAVDDVIGRIVERFGRVDVLANVAGTSLFDAPSVTETTDEQWEEMFRVNVRGSFFTCRAALPSMRSGGSIVNVGSVASVIAAPNDSAYTAAKGALLQFTRALALESAPRGIRANCVCPGIIDTPGAAEYLARAADREAELAAYKAFSPFNRLGTSREVANCVLFLASEESSLVNGVALMADGGSSIQ